MARKKIVNQDEELEIRNKLNDTEAEVDDTPAEDAVVDISLQAIRKKRFRIDGDDDRILYLDTSDFSILERYEKVLPKIGNCMKDSSDDVSTETMHNIDAELRELLDYIFDSNVSEVCAPSGYMFDLFNGEFRFEHIMQALLPLYEQNIEREYRKLRRNISKYTDKYTGKKK